MSEILCKKHEAWAFLCRGGGQGVSSEHDKPHEVDGFDIFADPDEAVLLAERAAKAHGQKFFS